MEALKNWLSAERGRGVRLARHLDVPASFVSKMADGDKPVPVEHGAPIEQFTGGEVTRKRLFPNDWQRIWPELATPDPAPTATTDTQPAAAQAEGVA